MSDLAAWLSGLDAPREASPRITEVQDTAEFRRIRDAERVSWADAPDLPALVRALTRKYRTPSGAQTLRDVQAGMLRALYDYGSAIGAIRTSGGKTLASFLAPEVVSAARPLLVVPAKLINSGKTHREHRAARKHWRLRPLLSARQSRERYLREPPAAAPLRAISYEALGKLDYAAALENWAPDLIVCDEIHKCKDTGTAVTRRLGRFVRTRRPRLLVMSGSLTNRSLGDYQHILRWILGDRTPLPRNYWELMSWRWALDEKVADELRLEPGALLGISPSEPDDGHGREAARKRYARRLLSVPGVITTGSDLPEVVLTCRKEQLQPTPEQIEVVDYLRANWETPCGHPFEGAPQLWAHEQETAAGFYYRWRKQPPPEWKVARKAWSSFVREILSHSRKLDSREAVAHAVRTGRLDDGGLLARWDSVSHLFRPQDHQEPVWITDQTVDYCARWLKREKGIVWTRFSAFGDKLSAVSGVPYFAAGAMAGGVAIDQHRGPAIAAVKAVNEGFNLQYLHCKNLVAQCLTTNEANEQLISRTHRDGQENDVEVIYLQTLDGCRKALQQARADARYVEQTTLAPTRLGSADWIDE